jgi:hypothetical protein
LYVGIVYYVQSVVDGNNFTVSYTNGGGAITLAGGLSGIVYCKVVSDAAAALWSPSVGTLSAGSLRSQMANYARLDAAAGAQTFAGTSTTFGGNVAVSGSLSCTGNLYTTANISGASISSTGVLQAVQGIVTTGTISRSETDIPPDTTAYTITVTPTTTPVFVCDNYGSGNPAANLTVTMAAYTYSVYTPNPEIDIIFTTFGGTLQVVQAGGIVLYSNATSGGTGTTITAKVRWRGGAGGQWYLAGVSAYSTSPMQ